MRRCMGIIITLLIVFLINIKTVYAQEIVYTNDHNVSFTEAEYNYFSEIYWDGIQKFITQDHKNMFSDIDFEHVTVDKRSLCYKRKEPLRDNTYEATYYDEITIAKSCGLLCKISTSARWLGEPSVKSHDVMGSLLNGPTRLGNPGTIIVGDDKSYPPSTVVYDTDGFGAVFQLPDAKQISIAQTFTYKGNGVVFASYQHALTPINLAHAQEFNIGIAGYGSVFAFYGNAVGVYDAGPGVYITV